MPQNTIISYFDKNLMKKYPDASAFLRKVNVENGDIEQNANESEEFRTVQINDFSQQELKVETQKYEESGLLPATNVCAAYHGGPLDYPKVVPTSVANIVEKWEFCYERLDKILIVKEERNALKATNSDEEVYEQLTGDSLRKKENPFTFDEVGKEDEDEEFFSAVSESTSKISLHSMKLFKELFKKGDVYALLKLIGGLALVRNKLWHYNEYVKVDGRAKAFQDQYNEICQMLEAMCEQLQGYHSSLVATSILHDPASHDWSNPKPFYEGEKISHSVQMWWYFLQGFKTDLWKSIPPKTAQKIFAKVFCDSLGILVTRYWKSPPSIRRMPQFRGDLTAILLISIEVLTMVCGCLDQLFKSDSKHQIAHDIHAKCNKIFDLLAIVGSPVHILSNVLPEAQKAAHQKQKMKPKQDQKDLSRIQWLNLMRPDLFSDRLDNISSSSHLSLLAKMVSNQPEPTWPILVQTILSRDMMIAKLIMMNFGAFVPGVHGDKVSQLMTEGCGGLQCRQNCLGAADILWPQSVGTGVMEVCLAGRRDSNVLCVLLEPLLKKFNGETWECLNKGNIWNIRKPVCLEGIVQIIEPYLQPVMMDFFAGIESGKTWTLAHVPSALKDMLLNLHDIVPLIPIPVFKVTKKISEFLPETVTPLGKSVLTHMIICSVHGVIVQAQPILKKLRVAKEKLDFVVAFGEALCNLENSIELLKIQDIADETIADFDSVKLPERNLDSIENDFSFIMAEIVANDLLSKANGVHALNALYRFFCYNVDWIHSCLGVNVLTSSSLSGNSIDGGLGGAIPVLIKPWGSEIFPPQNPYEMMNQIGGFWCDNSVPVVQCFENGDGGNQAPSFQLERILNISHPWDQYLRHVLINSNPFLIEDLLRLRFSHDDLDLTEQERSLVKAAFDAWGSHVQWLTKKLKG